MLEKVNKYHPDKVADRIAGHLVDYAYAVTENPHIAVEVLLGHGHATVILESDVEYSQEMIRDAVKDISGITQVTSVIAPQDPHLADNQKGEIRCGDNGVFKAQWNEDYSRATELAKQIGSTFSYDGKYLFDFQHSQATICQSNVSTDRMIRYMNDLHPFKVLSVNPLGDWTGGSDTDAGCTNRKLGSDQPFCNPNGLHGKDLSKADVSVTIYCNLESKMRANKMVTAFCSIGDDRVIIHVEGEGFQEVPFSRIVERAKNYIESIGGFEKFAEYGLV